MLKMPKITKSNNAPMALAYVITASKALRRTAFLACTFLLLLIADTLAPLYIDRNYSEALTGAPTLSETTLTLTTSDINLAINSISENGSFNASNNGNNVSVTTNNYTGYTLSISPESNETTARQLTITGNTTNVFNSISSATTAETYSASGSTGLNNTWGILPSKVDGVANTSYQPAPELEHPLVIEETSVANTTANNYSINMGARADYTNPVGTYAGTFIITATARSPRYAITYDANTTDTVSNLPSPQTSTSASSNQITLTSTTPTRTGYTFTSWNTEPDGTGDTYAAGATYYLDATTTNEETLYAIWTRNNATYTLTFSADTEDTVTNLPTEMTNTNNTGSHIFTIPTESTSIPTREGYNFLGWAEATGQTTPTYTWDGTAFTPATITLTQADPSNPAVSTTLYAVWKKDSVSIDDISYMQDFATSNKDLIASMVVNQQYQLTDRRDNKQYYVAKVQTSCDNPRVTPESNGNCYQVWMTQNLDLDLVKTAGVYTHDNTDLGWDNSNFNVDATFTPTRATSTSVWTGITASYFASYDPGDKYYRTSGSTSNDAATSTCSEDDCPHYHAGNYYTWNAAVANSLSNTNYNVRPNSICPAGWKLPTGMTSSTGYTDFNYLLVQQGIATNYVASGNATWQTNGFNNIRIAPLFFVRSGYVDTTSSSGSLSSVGGHGRYWSSSVGSSSDAYNLYFYYSHVSPADLSFRYRGFSVRCVARELDLPLTITYNANGGTGDPVTFTAPYGATLTTPNNVFARNGYIISSWNTEPDGSGTTYAAGKTNTTPSTGDTLTLYAQWKAPYYMQDVTKATIATALPNVGDTMTLYDNRDKTPYIVGHAADGNYWMLQNLKLGTKASSYTLKKTNSNTSGNFTLNGKLSDGKFAYSTNNDHDYTNDSNQFYCTDDYGCYYNWYTATAGSGTSAAAYGSVSYSICPKGWTLPTSSQLNALYSNYKSASLMLVNPTSSKDNTTGQIPGFLLGGYYNSDGANFVGSGGYYWSRTARGGGSVYYLRLSTSGVAPPNSSSPYYAGNYWGFAVRCLAL